MKQDSDHQDRARLQRDIAPTQAELRDTGRRSRTQDPEEHVPPRLRQQPPQDLARALDVRRRRRRPANEQRGRTITPRTRHPPQALPRHPQPRRRTLHRTRPLRLGHLPPPTPLPLHLPHPATHRPSTRRPTPHAHLNQEE